MRVINRTVGITLFALLIAGCGVDTQSSPILNPSKPIQDARDITEGLDVSSPCRAAFQAAAARSVTDAGRLDDAISACSSLTEWRSAAGAFPEVLDGADADQYLSGRCAASPGLAGTTLCQAVGN